MSDEPINHKLLARNKHRGGKSVDKNTSRGKYKKQEFEKKKKEKEELAKREQDPNYQKNSSISKDGDDYNGSGGSDDSGDDDEEVFVKHSRSKYSKRILVQKDNSKLVQLDEKYYNQNSMLNMQSLIDSKVDFIPKFNSSSTSTTDLILDELNNDFNKKVNVNNSNNSSSSSSSSSSNSLNISEIEKMLSSFDISKRLNVDEYYLNSMKLPNPSNIVYLKRKSNKHLAAETTPTNIQTTPSSSSSSSSSIIDSNTKKKEEESKMKKEQEEFEKVISSPIKDTANEPPIDNGNVTSDNLEDWLDSII